MALPRADKFTKIWMALLVGLWVLSAVVVRWVPQGLEAFRLVTFDLNDVVHFQLWSALTYPFFHDVSSPFGVLLNCLILYFFAPQIRARWGTQRLVLFAVLTTLGGAIGTSIAGLFGLSSVAYGSGAIVTGLVVAWGLTFPDRTILAMFVIPMRAIHVVYLTGFMIVLESLSTGTRAALHAGGFVTALLLVLGLWKGNQTRLWWDKFLTLVRIRKKPKLTLVPSMGGKGPGKGPDKFVQ